MKRSYRIALSLVLILSVLWPGLAFADKKEHPDKADEALEPSWNPTPGSHIQAGVPEQEPLNGNCPGQPFSCGDILRPAAITPGDNDYITFTLNGGDIVSFGTDSDPTGGIPMDTFIHLYKGTSCSPVDEIASDDDGGPGLASLLSYCVPAGGGGTYTGRIRGYSTTTTGTYRAFVICSGPAGGETCAAAPLLRCGSVNLSGNTACNVNDYSPATSDGCTGYTAAGRDVVYYFDANVGLHINLTYTSLADGSIYLAQVPAGSNCLPVAGATCLKGADATLTGQPETLDYTTVTSGTFYLILDSFGTNTSGAWTLTGMVDCPVGVDSAAWTAVKVLFR